MNNTKKRQVEIAKNMLEVEIPFEDIVEVSGLTLEEIKKLSKEVTIRVREAEDVVDFDLRDTLYHYDDPKEDTQNEGGAVSEEPEQ